MNLKTLFPITLVMLLTILLPGMARAQIDHDLKELRDQHSKAVAAALDPINRHYKESLEQLLRRATQAGELDAAVKIKEEISQITAATAETMSIPNFAEKLTKQPWTWTSHPGGRDRVDFTKDGVVIHNGWSGAVWTAKKPNLVVITMGAASATLKFNDTMSSFEGTDFGGAHPVKGEHF